MKVYMIRHARSIANEAKVWTGRQDIPLSSEGVAEQMAICEVFSYPRAELYFSSPLLRCIQSFEIIYGHPLDYISDELCECSLGALEGKPYINLDDDPNYVEWITFPEKQIEGGESFREFTERACRGFERLLLHIREKGLSSAAGTLHGNVMRAILHRFADPRIPHGEWRIPNGGMYVLDFDEEMRLCSWDTAPDFLFK